MMSSFTVNDECSEVITHGPELCDNEEGSPSQTEVTKLTHTLP